MTKQKFIEIHPPKLEPKKVSNIQQYLKNVIELLEEMKKENNIYLEKLKKENNYLKSCLKI